MKFPILSIFFVILIGLVPSRIFSQEFHEIAKLFHDDQETPEIYADDFGRSVAIDGNLAIVGAPRGGKKGDSPSGAAVVYEFDSNIGEWHEIRRLIAPYRLFGTSFGMSVSISGDIAIVGEPRSSFQGNNGGSAYIFAKDQGGRDNWGLVKKLTASDAEFQDAFGISVSINGGIAIVGAYRDDDEEISNDWYRDIGSAYIFAKDQGGADNWGQIKKLYASDASADDAFGTSVSISGELAIVGAPNGDADDLIKNRGSAYIFAKDQGGIDNWGQVKKLVAGDDSTQNSQGNINFGASVAIDGDFGIVGKLVTSGIEVGSAYIFAKDQGGPNNWGQIKKLTAANGKAYSFGCSVSIDGDMAIVGSNGQNLGEKGGSAYLYAKDHTGANNWGQIKKLTDNTTHTIYDTFGHSVSVSGNQILIGGKKDSYKRGFAHHFTQDRDSVDIWKLQSKLTGGVLTAGDRFGVSVAISGEIAIVGASTDDNDSGFNSGSAYIFVIDRGGDNSWTQIKRLSASDASKGDNFGKSVSINNNIAIVGANNHDGKGSAYIFAKDQGGIDNWGLVKKLTASGKGFRNNFGISVSISDNIAIVGADQERSAYIFAKDQGGINNWGQVKKLTSGDEETGWVYFGRRVDISNDVAIVGAPNRRGEDYAYIFAKDQGGKNRWGQVTKLMPLDSINEKSYGITVSICDNLAIIGMTREHPHNGMAYLFEKDRGGKNNWGQVSKLMPTETDNSFGTSVSVTSDMAIVSGMFEIRNSPSRVVYLFSKDHGGTDNWGQSSKVISDQVGERFGLGIAIEGNTALIGAHLNHANGHDSGTVYVYSLDE